MLKKFVLAAVAVGALVGAGAGLASASSQSGMSPVIVRTGDGGTGIECRGCLSRGGTL